MKKLLSLAVICLFSTALMAQSQAEKDFAIKYLKSSHELIVKTVSELSDEA